MVALGHQGTPCVPSTRTPCVWYYRVTLDTLCLGVIGRTTLCVTGPIAGKIAFFVNFTVCLLILIASLGHPVSSMPCAVKACILPDTLCLEREGTLPDRACPSFPPLSGDVRGIQCEAARCAYQPLRAVTICPA